MVGPGILADTLLRQDQVALKLALCVISVTGLAAVLRGRERVRESRWLMLVCMANLVVSVLAITYFVSMFDPHYHLLPIGVFTLAVRSLLTLAPVLTTLALDPRRYLCIPKWLIAVGVFASMSFFFAFAFPTVIRSQYGTWVEFGIPGERTERLLVMGRANPEREWQRAALVIALAGWGTTLAVGRRLYVAKMSQRAPFPH